jgi:hypothetical protein
MRVSELREKLRSLENGRQPWLDECKKVSELIIPMCGHYSGRAQEPIRMGHNTKAAIYLNNLVSMLFSGLTNPSKQWFRLTVGDTQVHEWDSARTWMAKVQEIMYSVLMRSNFYQEVQNLYRELIGFGTACMGMERDSRSGRIGQPVFSVYTAGTYSAELDIYGGLEAVYRKVWMSAADVYRRWGRACSVKTREMAKREPYSKIELCHAVLPRDYFDDRRLDGLNMRYASYWWENGADTFLSESGFRDFPYFYGRWDNIPGSAYGLGLGWSAIRSAQAMMQTQKLTVYGLNKILNPPTLVPASLAHDFMNEPGGVTFYPDGQMPAIAPVQPMPSDITAGASFLEIWEADLRQIFMNDLFIYMNQAPARTATEISTINEEKLLMLGAVLERIQKEFLYPMLERVFMLLQRENMFPEPPAELLGMEIKPQFLGTLAQAQRQTGVDKVIQAASFISGLAREVPSVADKFDFDQAVDTVTTMLGLPPDIILGDDEVERKRRERQESN